MALGTALVLASSLAWANAGIPASAKPGRLSGGMALAKPTAPQPGSGSAPPSSQPAPPSVAPSRTAARIDVVGRYGDVARGAYDRAAALDVAGAATEYDAFFAAAFGSADGLLDALRRTRERPSVVERAERAVLLRAASDMLLLHDLEHAAAAPAGDAASARVLVRGLLGLFDGDKVHARACAHALWTRLSSFPIGQDAGPMAVLADGDGPSAARVKAAIDAEAKREHVPLAWGAQQSTRTVTTTSGGGEVRIHCEIKRVGAPATEPCGTGSDVDVFARDLVRDWQREQLAAFAR